VNFMPRNASATSAWKPLVALTLVLYCMHSALGQGAPEPPYEVNAEKKAFTEFQRSSLHHSVPVQSGFVSTRVACKTTFFNAFNQGFTACKAQSGDDERERPEFDKAAVLETLKQHPLGWFVQCVSERPACESVCSDACGKGNGVQNASKKACKSKCEETFCSKQCAICDPNATKVELGSLFPCDAFPISTRPEVVNPNPPKNQNKVPSRACPDDMSDGTVMDLIYAADGTGVLQFHCNYPWNVKLNGVTPNGAAFESFRQPHDFNVQIVTKALLIHAYNTPRNMIAVGFKRVLCHQDPSGAEGNKACDAHRVTHCLWCPHDVANTIHDAHPIVEGSESFKAATKCIGGAYWNGTLKEDYDCTPRMDQLQPVKFEVKKGGPVVDKKPGYLRIKFEDIAMTL